MTATTETLGPALVTGASSGIGLECARRLAADGRDLVLAARRVGRLEDLRAELESDHDVDVRVGGLDVRDRSAVRAFVDGLRDEGRSPEILVNNAGLAAGKAPLHEGSFEDWDRMIDTNLKGLLNVTRFVLPLMVRRDRGHVVNLGSIAGHTVYPGGNVYNATKFGVRALNQAMNVDLEGTRVRVSCISPGAVETEFSRVRFHGDEERASEVYEGYRPLGPEDVADAVAYVVNAPPHVSVHEMVIMPTAQRSPYVLDREWDDRPGNGGGS